MLDFIVSPPGFYGCSGEYPVRASIEDETTYAYFARYFAAARLDAGNHNFLGFWGGTEVSGYQLVRLRQVLEDALSDLRGRPPRFRVLRGWSGPERTEATEVWEDVDREVLIEIALEIIAAIDLARSTTGHLQALGD